jgi:hypothetical protein
MQGISQRVPVMEIKVPLSRFLFCLKEAKKFDQEYPSLSQVEWLLANFRCDDESATYEPTPLDIGPAALAWWIRASRN